jgi:hypothetical protein
MRKARTWAIPLEMAVYVAIILLFGYCSLNSATSQDNCITTCIDLGDGTVQCWTECYDTNNEQGETNAIDNR